MKPFNPKEFIVEADGILALDGLPPEVVEAVTSKRVSGKKKLQQWIEFLKTLARFDEQVDARLKQIKSRVHTFGTATFVALCVTIFLTFATEGNRTVLWIGGTLLVIFFGIFITFWNKSNSLQEINLDNSIRETLLPLLEILSEDIPPKGKISLVLNMGDPAAEENRISEKELPPGSNRCLIERIYRVQTIHAAIPLTNGSQLILDLVKQPASYDRYYSNRRGKSKHKQKWKMLTLVTAGLAPNADDFAVDAAEVDRLSESEKVKLKQICGGQLCCLTRKFKSKSAVGVPEETLSPDLVLDMCMKLCAMLNPAG
jgi:hypothetical protein